MTSEQYVSLNIYTKIVNNNKNHTDKNNHVIIYKAQLYQ